MIEQEFEIGDKVVSKMERTPTGSTKGTVGVVKHFTIDKKLGLGSVILLTSEVSI